MHHQYVVPIVCGTSFDVRHALSCRKGGLIITCHNEVSDKIIYLAQRVFPLESVHGKPLIRQETRRPYREICQVNYRLETKGDVLIHGLWDR